MSETNTFYGIKNSFSLTIYFILKFREYKCLTIWISTLNPLCTRSIQIVSPTPVNVKHFIFGQISLHIFLIFWTLFAKRCHFLQYSFVDFLYKNSMEKAAELHYKLNYGGNSLLFNYVMACVINHVNLQF